MKIFYIHCKPEMTSTLILMHIKDKTMIVELFDGCNFGNAVMKNSRGQTLYGEPLIMDGRGERGDDVYVMMSWSEHNASVVGKVVGYLDDDTDSLVVNDEKYLPILENAGIMITEEQVDAAVEVKE